ncbi:hypothetical protein AWN76_009275 [Rhodothermaceae bacterium RA]|nr:hypothetical protein AWN76_009275 [Rhodothermaceae bacterium RA]
MPSAPRNGLPTRNGSPVNGSPVSTAAPLVRAADILPSVPASDAMGHTALGAVLADRTVLLTGAGGSIGTQLSRHLADLRPRHLVLVDVSEYNVFRLEQALHRAAPGVPVTCLIADVRDADRMASLFATHRPDLVIHAAAYKHVPLMERHPIEAFRNNTRATAGLLRLAEAHGAEQFILVSTDKAVEPSGVLGYTKRLAEWYVASATPPLAGKVVRFGNVFGSQGSVVPLFREQILRGGPVTLTHPAMQRFFMSTEAACRLVLQTIGLDEASIFVLRTEPVSILWLARRMIEHLKPWTPGPVAIEYVGLRPGEKLTERLWEPEERPVPTAHAGILGLDGPPPPPRADLDALFDRIEALCRTGRAEAVREALRQSLQDVAVPRTA